MQPYHHVNFESISYQSIMLFYVDIDSDSAHLLRQGNGRVTCQRVINPSVHYCHFKPTHIFTVSLTLLGLAKSIVPIHAATSTPVLQITGRQISVEVLKKQNQLNRMAAGPRMIRHLQ